MKLRRSIVRRLQTLAVKYPYPLVLAEQIAQHARQAPARLQRRLGLRRLPATAAASPPDATVEVLPAEVARLIAGARNRLWLEFAVAFVLRMALVGVLLIAGAGFLHLVTPLPVPVASLWAVPAALIAWSLLLGLRNRPTEWQAAKLVDRRLGLRQRLSTAMELLAKPSQSPIERLQIDDAIRAVRAVERGRQVPVLLPGQEARLVAGGLAAALVLTVVATVFNFSLLAPSPERRALLAEVQKAQQIQRELDERGVASGQPPNSVVGAITQLLNKVTGRSSNADTARQLSDAEQKIANEVKDSYNKEQALNQLAQTWREASATRQVADSLAQGDYERAAAEIEKLAERLEDLSPEALKEMASGLEEAAKQSMPYDQQLANTMQRASEELKRNQANQARDRLRDLSQQTQQVGESVAARNQLTDALSDIRESQQALSELMGTPEDLNGQPGNQQPGGTAGSEGGEGTGNDEANLSGEPSALREGEVRSAQSQTRASSLTPVGGATARQEAGEAAGDHATVDVQPPTLNGPSQQVQTQTPDPNARPEIGRGGPPSVSPGITGRINASPDTTTIPWQFKALVRDYFTRMEARNP